MPDLKVLRVVIASPGDVQPERDIVNAALADVNRSVAADRNVLLVPLMWETDVYPGFHPEGPQGLIDEVLHPDDCDLLVGIFWKRFGTPTSDAGSGTEHEFRLAYQSWKSRRRPQIMMYFSQAPYTPASKAETDQWGSVLEFRRTFPGEGLWWSYDGPKSFDALDHNHITNWVRKEFPLTETNTRRLDSSSREVDSAFHMSQEDLIAAERRLFVGRQNVLCDVKQFMETHERGYFIIRGGPGQGKTALACQLLAAQPSVYHFIARTSGRSDGEKIEESLAKQLRSLGESLGVERWFTSFRILLIGVGAKSKFLIVIDGLDELPETGGQFDTPYLITKGLPKGTFFAVTSRPCRRLEDLEQDIHDLPHAICDLQPLTPAEIGDLFHALEQNLSPGEVERVAEAAQGNPLYLRAVADELRINPQFDLNQLPKGVEGFFRRAVGTVSPGSTTLSNVLGVLAAARTPFSMEDLSNLTEMPQRSLYIDAIQPIEQFLLCNRDRYTLYHERFRDFVTQKLLYADELRQAHRTIANWLLRREMHSHPYRYDALAYHLFNAGDRKRLIEVVNAEFVSAKASRMGYGVLEDLELVSQVLLATGDPKFLDQCTALLNAVGSRADSIAPKLSRAFTIQKSRNQFSGSRAIEQAISYVPGFDVFATILPKATAPADFVEGLGGNGRLSLAVGDAPSFGIQSAFVARFVANLFRTLVEQSPHRTMSEVLSDIDRTIQPSACFERISMQCISFDRGRGIASLATAGHPYPVYYSARRKKCDILPVRGELLHETGGATPDRMFQEYTLDINAGDAIVMITDGLTEDYLWQGEPPYGYRFTAVIEEHIGEGSRGIANAILSDWQEHKGSRWVSDDVTVMVAVIRPDA